MKYGLPFRKPSRLERFWKRLVCLVRGHRIVDYGWSDDSGSSVDLECSRCRWKVPGGKRWF